MLELILLQLEGLEIILQPIIDTQYFGCPDDCIIQGSQRHDMINLLFSPVTFIGIGVAIVVGVLVKLIRRKSQREEPVYESESFKKYFDKKKTEKREFLQNKLPVDPQEAYDNYIKSLDSTHPQTDNIKSVHTETKEADLITPEQKMVKSMKEEPKVVLDDDLLKVEVLMEKEHLTENEAVEKIIEGIKKTAEISEEDLFNQDNQPRKLPPILTKLIKKFKKKKTEKTIEILTELGIKRRDEYGKIINAKFLDWIFPLQRYRRSSTDAKGRKTTVVVNEIEDEKIHEEIKKLALFCSMAEFMVDKKHKKKRYWRKIPVE